MTFLNKMKAHAAYGCDFFPCQRTWKSRDESSSEDKVKIRTQSVVVAVGKQGVLLWAEDKPVCVCVRVCVCVYVCGAVFRKCIVAAAPPVWQSAQRSGVCVCVCASVCVLVVGHACWMWPPASRYICPHFRSHYQMDSVTRRKDLRLLCRRRLDHVSRYDASESTAEWRGVCMCLRIATAVTKTALRLALCLVQAHTIEALVEQYVSDIVASRTGGSKDPITAKDIGSATVSQVVRGAAVVLVQRVRHSRLCCVYCVVCCAT